MNAALAGVLVTASVSLIGVLATWQANRRTRQEHRDEQARLKLDAAMRAGALFSSEQGSDPASIASGLLALTRDCRSRHRRGAEIDNQTQRPTDGGRVVVPKRPPPQPLPIAALAELDRR
jgi:hypothetical protein